MNLYTYVQNDPLIYVDPSGCKEIQSRDIAIQAGGTVSWNGTTGIATVTVNGKTATYNIKDYKVVNGRIIVKDTDFNTTFSIKASSNTPGTTGYGINANAHCGVTLGASGQYVKDNSGNNGIAISLVPFTGGATPSVGVTGTRSTTNANSI